MRHASDHKFIFEFYTMASVNIQAKNKNQNWISVNQKSRTEFYIPTYYKFSVFSFSMRFLIYGDIKRDIWYMEIQTFLPWMFTTV